MVYLHYFSGIKFIFCNSIYIPTSFSIEMVLEIFIAMNVLRILSSSFVPIGCCRSVELVFHFLCTLVSLQFFVLEIDKKRLQNPNWQDYLWMWTMMVWCLYLWYYNLKIQMIGECRMSRAQCIKITLVKVGFSLK